MKHIRVAMPDDVFDRLKARAKDAGYSTIASFLLSRVSESNHQSEAAHIVNLALKKAQRQKRNVSFLLRDLVKDWDELDKGVRIRAGRYFFEAIGSGDYDVKPGRKLGSGHQTYIHI